MIPSPKQLQQTIDEQDKTSYDNLRSTIVSYLINSYDKGKTLSYSVNASLYKDRLIRNLCEEIKQSGWKCEVELFSDQRDGDFWKFSISAP